MFLISSILLYPPMRLLPALPGWHPHQQRGPHYFFGPQGGKGILAVKRMAGQHAPYRQLHQLRPLQKTLPLRPGYSNFTETPAEVII